MSRRLCVMPEPPRRCVFGRDACCYYTNDAKMVAASGIAPDSPRLQRGANLSQLRSQWSLRAVSRRGLRLLPLCSYRSAFAGMRFRAVHSRLSDEGSAFELRRNEEWSPDVVTLHGLPLIKRPVCF